MRKRRNSSEAQHLNAVLESSSLLRVKLRLSYWIEEPIFILPTSPCHCHEHFLLSAVSTKHGRFLLSSFLYRLVEIWKYCYALYFEHVASLFLFQDTADLSIRFKTLSAYHYYTTITMASTDIWRF